MQHPGMALHAGAVAWCSYAAEADGESRIGAPLPRATTLPTLASCNVMRVAGFLSSSMRTSCRASALTLGSASSDTLCTRTGFAHACAAALRCVC